MTVSDFVGLLALFASMFLLGVQRGIELQEKKSDCSLKIYNALERVEKEQCGLYSAVVRKDN